MPKRSREETNEEAQSLKSPILAAKAPPPPAKEVKWSPHYPPQTGEIDLDKYDLPQSFSQLEWWYFNTHLTSKKNGERFSVFSSFFRQVNDESDQKNREFYDACTWAISDVENKEYYPDSLLDHRSCNVLVKKLDPKFTGRKCNHAEGPLLELAQQNRLPKPDRAMKKASVIGKDRLSINLDNECVVSSRPAKSSEKQKVGAPKTVYEVRTKNPHNNTATNLTFVPQQVVMRHGVHGVVNEMFYYYIPRMSVTGTVTVNGETHEVEGSGWYDREFGASEDVTGRDALDAWTWFSIQLSDGTEFSLYNVVDREKHIEKEKVAVLSDSNGGRQPITDFQLTYKGNWTSLSTYVEYPTDWKLVVPSIQLELYISAAFAHQEFTTVLVTGGGFFEGRMHVNGSRQGKAVTGIAFLERKNFIQYNDTAGMLKSVGRFVRKTLSEMYPLDASQEWINKNVLGRQCTGRGTPPKAVCDTMFRPVRALTDRGGKAWRSLIMVSSMNAISKRYIDCSRYIALAELLHVGSLIIDDIQDESTVRRGGKCVHLEYGMATAINSGTGCYFMAPLLGGIDDLPPAKQLAIYQLYFDVLRSGHAGQGLDIAGLDHMMPAVVETGETQELLDALRAIHTYKTGGAAGTICRMACIIADATPEQSDAFENYGTKIGLAFQIVDDALNLRGFEGDLKEVGEDIRDGKVTYPIISAMSKLGKTDRQYIWTVLQEKTSDPGKIASVIQMLNSVGAIDACLEEARDFVETAWARLDKVVDDSLPKIMMRCFAKYLTERTY